MLIPSGNGRNGDLSIAIILKKGNTFLASLSETYHQASIKTASKHYSQMRG
jgi:hypothetical protein